MKLASTTRLLTACGLAMACLGSFAQAQNPASVIRFIPMSEVVNFDPIMEVTRSSSQHGYMIYDTLFSLDARGVPQPQMVESYKADASGRTYTMVLRPRLKFHDGSAVTAADAVASIDRWAKKDTLGKRLAALGLKAAVVDERTFTVTTDKPSSLVLTAFAKPTGSPLFVMRAKDAANEPTQRVTANIGSGPFRFVAGEYVPGSKIVYERNADYVPRAEPASFLAGGKRVHVNRVEFRIITDPSTATAALASGEVDIYEAPPADLLPQLQRSKEVVTKVIDKGGIMTVIRPNTLQPPFDNVLARRALLHAVDQSDYVQLMGGAKGEFARQCHSFLGCGFEGYSEAGMDEFKKPSTEKAKALLKQAGYKGEPIIVMHPMEYPPITDQTSVAVEQLRKAGFNVQPMSMDWAALTARRANRGPAPEGGWNLFLTYTYSFNMASPALNFYLASPCGGGGWFGWPCDKKIEALTDEWMAEVDLSKRSAIERQIHLQARESLPYVPVSQSFSPVAYRKNIVDLMEVPATVFWNVRKTAK